MLTIDDVRSIAGCAIADVPAMISFRHRAGESPVT
jgi:hypothetical protein